IKRIATINATDAYGQAEAKHLKDNAAKYGVTVVAAETFQVTDTSFTPQLIKVRAANPELIYNGSIGGPAILLYKGYKQLNMTTPIVLSQAALTKPLFDAVGGPAAVKGAMTPTQAGTIGEEFGGPTAVLYVELQKQLGRRPLFFNSFGYDYGIITKHAVDKSDGTRDSIRAELDKIKDLPTINGIITFKPEDHTGTDYRSIRMAVFNGTKFEIAK
ncbi:MAG: ABC transporter substrate-binding protein, partial [Alphaproteobacteria bacterium]